MAAVGTGGNNGRNAVVGRTAAGTVGNNGRNAVVGRTAVARTPGEQAKPQKGDEGNGLQQINTEAAGGGCRSAVAGSGRRASGD
ncbi:hypothetical protein [Paenibacillus sp. P46E]|uniref:hypothetical protein n=1 Tax=Paenibacillus sp. P46E TaxID=1349436 RepID=UPI001C4A2185|nr:hypothetical protein [Paenibacillus sp. P46E]